MASVGIECWSLVLFNVIFQLLKISFILILNLNFLTGGEIKTLIVLFYTRLYFLASLEVSPMPPPWYSLSPLFPWDMHELVLSEHLATKSVIHPRLWAFTFYFLLCFAPFS